jgi:hypothetical protein
MLGYANMLLERGETENAREWYTNLAALGDPRAAERLANIAVTQGDRERAWQELGRAARLAHDHLQKHGSQIRTVYGPDGVAVHVGIIAGYAEGLQRRGEAEAAALWRDRIVGP